MQNLTKRPEPVLNRGILAGTLITFVKAGVAFATALGWLDWDTAQTTAFNAFVIAGIDVAILGVTFWRVRGMVTPVESPRDNQGRKLEAEGD